MTSTLARGRPINGKLSAIEAGRGLAAVAVVLYHVARHLDKAGQDSLLKSIFQFGHAGVDFFFVISGFIILYIHYQDVGQPRRIGRYARRRFTRVMPTYWIALSLTVAMGAAGSHAQFSVADLFWSVSLLPSDHDLILGVAWTLRYEVLFYSVFAVLILNRTIGMALLAVWFCTVIAVIADPARFGGLPGPFADAYCLEFFIGMGVAYWVRNYVVPVPRITFLMGTVLFATACLAEDVDALSGYSTWARLAYGLSAALIVVGAAAAERERPIRVPSLLRILGAASYSVYLFQFIFIGLAWQALLHVGLDQSCPAVIAFMLLAVAGIGGGVVMSQKVELPVMRLVRGERPATEGRPATVR